MKIFVKPVSDSYNSFSESLPNIIFENSSRGTVFISIDGDDREIELKVSEVKAILAAFESA